MSEVSKLNFILPQVSELILMTPVSSTTATGISGVSPQRFQMIDKEDSREVLEIKREDCFVGATINDLKSSEAFVAMVTSENVLAKEWNTPEEDKAWEHL